MDLNYLLQRYGISLNHAANAASESARAIHRDLADAYAERIAALRHEPCIEQRA